MMSVDPSRMREIEGAGTVELVCVGRLLRMGCDPFVMSVCGSVGGGENLWEENGLPWEHSAENQWKGGGGGGQRQKAQFSRGEKGGRLRQKT